MPFETDSDPDGAHEFDPIGTLTIVALYFLILIAAWIYMYFVEFVGNDPTIIGGVLV